MIGKGSGPRVGGLRVFSLGETAAILEWIAVAEVQDHLVPLASQVLERGELALPLSAPRITRRLERLDPLLEEMLLEDGHLLR